MAIAALSPWFALLSDAASFGVSALCIFFARARFEEMPVKTGRLQISELKDGPRFFREVRLASTLLTMTVVVNACSQPSGIALNVHVLRTLGGSPAFPGVIGSVSAGAALLTSLRLAAPKTWPHLDD